MRWPLFVTILVVSALFAFQKSLGFTNLQVFIVTGLYLIGIAVGMLESKKQSSSI